MKNLMIQISGKLGHTPWGFKHLPLMKSPTMIIGIDVCKKVGKNDRTVVCLVSSIDKHIGKFYSDYESIGENQELPLPIEKMFKKAIMEFEQKNSNASPKNLIIYRDAVSEGQAEETLNTEVSQIKSAISSLMNSGDLSSEPQVLFMLANKRIEQRFWTENRQK